MNGLLDVDPADDKRPERARVWDFTISEKEFGYFQRLLFAEAGITLGPAKKALVVSRLAKRLRFHALGSFSEYIALLDGEGRGDERRLMIELLTTNETYFFREAQHLEYLREWLGTHWRGQTFRVWSGACSTGEEPYSVAMILQDCLGEGRWEMIASDINRTVLGHAERGIYDEARVARLPREYLYRYMLKGKQSQRGKYLVAPELRRGIRFKCINLNEDYPSLGQFDAIFMRNVMIYFNQETKSQVVSKAVRFLKTGGHFFIGQAESLHGLTAGLTVVRPSIYRRR